MVHNVDSVLRERAGQPHTKHASPEGHALHDGYQADGRPESQGADDGAGHQRVPRLPAIISLTTQLTSCLGCDC